MLLVFVYNPFKKEAMFVSTDVMKPKLTVSEARHHLTPSERQKENK